MRTYLDSMCKNCCSAIVNTTACNLWICCVFSNPVFDTAVKQIDLFSLHMTGPREYNRNDSKEAIARLSKGVEVMQGGEVMTSGVARSSMDMKLEIPDVPSEDLKMFPDTPEGYVSMVRWYSLQFLLEELSRGLSELAENLETLLQNMPSYGVKM